MNRSIQAVITTVVSSHVICGKMYEVLQLWMRIGDYELKAFTGLRFQLKVDDKPAELVDVRFFNDPCARCFFTPRNQMRKKRVATSVGISQWRILFMRSFLTQLFVSRYGSWSGVWKLNQ